MLAEELFMRMTKRYSTAEERRKAMLAVAAIVLSGCATDKPPSLDLSRPGRSQDELDRFQKELYEYFSTYQENFLTPEQINAYKKAADYLLVVRQREGPTAGLGGPDDYLVSIGETSDFYVIEFIGRLRASEPSSYGGDLSTHWSTFYNYGDFQSVMVVYSKPEMVLECFAVSLLLCPENIIDKLESSSSNRK